MSERVSRQPLQRRGVVSHGWSRLWSFCVRHRASIGDLGILAAVFAACLYLAFEIEIFLTEAAMTDAQRRVSLNESLLLGGLLVLGLLIFAIRRYRDLRREVGRRTAAERRARELAFQDTLTGLPNRRQFEDALRQAIASPPDTGFNHALFMLDLNGFKQVNDNYGHSTGDELLIIAAQRLLGCVREGDLVARLGGDEFVVLALHLLGPEAAANIAVRIVQGFDTPIAAGSATHHIATGIGIALFPGDADSAGEMLRKADVALYRAKAERRSAYRFFEEEMDALLREREAMERALKAAMGEGRIEPRFYPSYDLASGRVTGFEAIPMWTTPEGAEIPPERFLPIAEETGLIHALAASVLEQACTTAATWPEEVTLSMDVLPGQISDPTLGSRILEILSRTALPPRRLEIEVAENIVVNHLEAAKLALAPLREAGVSIALDNFGTGYSNLYHMREFRIDKVKIARRLVEGMGQEDSDRVVRALAGLGRGLGIAVSAEGLEGDARSPAAAGLLLGAGVAEGQGSDRLVTVQEAQHLLEAGAA